MSTIKGWKFPIDVDKSTGKILTVSDNDAVKQDIKMILQTQRGERKMRESYGANINQFMFETVDSAFVKNMSKRILDSIDLWEEHVPQMNVQVSQSPEMNSKVIVDVDYITDIEPHQEKLVTEVDLNKAE